METAKVILAGLWGGCLGFSTTLFALQGNWAMVALIAGIVVIVFYLILWIMERR